MPRLESVRRNESFRILLSRLNGNCVLDSRSSSTIASSMSRSRNSTRPCSSSLMAIVPRRLISGWTGRTRRRRSRTASMISAVTGCPSSTLNRRGISLRHNLDVTAW
ncbi:hypothetical protein ABW21_db0209470 [Orbilia brochopaga]|nr:hypothetical protein ABW21_db0209470 [Drechslerella brochopaga]